MISTQTQHENQYYPMDYDELLSTRSGSMKRLLEYDIRDLNYNALQKHYNKLQQLADFARLSRIQISFNGLNDYTKKNEVSTDCDCLTKEISLPERELIELMIDIQTKSLPSARKYELDLIF